MKKIIIESKSISDVVVKVGNDVGAEIIGYVQSKPLKMSRLNMTNFADGRFSVRVNNFFKRWKHTNS